MQLFHIYYYTILITLNTITNSTLCNWMGIFHTFNNVYDRNMSLRILVLLTEIRGLIHIFVKPNILNFIM